MWSMLEGICVHIYIYKCAATQIFKWYNLSRWLKLSPAIWLGFAFLCFLSCSFCPCIEFIMYVQVCWPQIRCLCMWSSCFRVAKNTYHWYLKLRTERLEFCLCSLWRVVLKYLGLEQEETWKPVVLLQWYFLPYRGSKGTPGFLAQQNLQKLYVMQGG